MGRLYDGSSAVGKGTKPEEAALKTTLIILATMLGRRAPSSIGRTK